MYLPVDPAVRLCHPQPVIDGKIVAAPTKQISNGPLTHQAMLQAEPKDGLKACTHQKRHMRMSYILMLYTVRHAELHPLNWNPKPECGSARTGL